MRARRCQTLPIDKANIGVIVKPTPLQKVALIAASVGVNIGDFLPDAPIRVGNKSLSEDAQNELIQKAAEKRLRKSKKLQAVHDKKGGK